MIDNIKMNPVPHEMIADFDPSAMTLYRSTQNAKASLPKMDAARLKALRLNDFDKFVMLLLAAVHMVSNAQMKAILTAVPSPESPVGFEGMASDLMERFGVAFNIHKAIGHLHNKDAAYQALNRLAHRGLVRTILQGRNVRVRTELAGLGVTAGWGLTPLGAAVILFLTNKSGLPVVRDAEGKVVSNPNLTVDDLKFVVHESKVGLDRQVHDLGVSAYLTGLMVGASYYCNREKKPLAVDVCQVIGDGRDFDINGTKMSRPDLSVVVFIRSVFIPLLLEWDTQHTTDKKVTEKANAHMRLMVEGTQDWKAGKPWLVFACPESKVKNHERAIRLAAKNRGLLEARTYDPMDTAGIVVCSHEDLGGLSPYGAIYRVFDYKTGKLSEDKFTLVSLKRARKGAEVPASVEPTHGEPVGEKSCPREWWQMKKGASSALVGYRDTNIHIDGSSALLVGYIPEGVA